MALALLLLPCIWTPAAARDVPRPQLKPDRFPAVASSLPSWPRSNGSWPAAVVAHERKTCMALLQGLAVDFVALAPLGADGGCGAAAPIEVKSVAGIDIVPPMKATCAFVSALHAWVTTSLQPSARQYLKQEAAAIENASDYVCRRRNSLSRGKLSEHAKANALDIARIRFRDGGSTSIAGDWSGMMGTLGLSAKAAFLARIRRDACIRFTTVLGPGSDSFHKDHFHIDVAKRRGGFRICK